MDEFDAGHFLCDIRLLRDDIDSWTAYPFCLPAFQKLSRLEFHPKATYIIGENGMGKSTLLEAIAIALGFNPEGGTKNLVFSTRDTHSELHDYLRISRGAVRPKDGFFLRAESVYNLASSADDNARENGSPTRFGSRSLHAQSHGESFFTIFLRGMFGNGLYILDEPEAALSPTRQMALLTRIHQLIGMNSQFIIATHSPIVMAYPDSLIYEITEDGFSKVQYTKTDHYRITKEFINNHEKMVAMLLSDD